MDQKMNARIWGRTRGDYNFPVMERVIYGTPAAQALLAEVERLGKHRIFLVVSNSLNRNTDEIERVKQTLGARFAGLYDQIPQHTTRESVIAAANAASAASADLVVAIGGGSVV